MIFEQHYLECLSQASYFIGDETTGRAVVVDPRRDIAPYIESAAEHDMSIELVIETHFHADFLSGHLEVAEATGATIAYGSVADTEFESRKLAHGERISLGEVELEVRHTPGHTPESISIVVYEHRGDDVPHSVLTGDTMFIGDVGRPDLLSSQGVTSEELAGSLYDSLHNELLTLPDATRLYPGHGAGSACGKNLSTDTTSSIGEQRATNYALAPMSKAEFVAVVTDGQTAPPAYFQYDATMNRAVRDVFHEQDALASMTLAQLLAAQANDAVVLDSRSPEDFAAGHLIGSINVGLAGRYSEFVGGIIDAGTQIVIVADDGHAAESRTRLARIGFDDVLGFLDQPLVAFAENPDHVKQGSRLDATAMRNAMATVDDLQIVDVRQPGETTGGVIDGAVLVPLTRLSADHGTLDPAKPTIIYCAGGFRSSIAASKLAAVGFTDVSDLLGGYGAWQSTDSAISTN